MVDKLVVSHSLVSVGSVSVVRCAFRDHFIDRVDVILGLVCHRISGKINRRYHIFKVVGCQCQCVVGLVIRVAGSLCQMVHDVPECRIQDVAVCVIADGRQNSSFCILDVELVLSFFQLAASESLGSADRVLTLCVVEVLERVSKCKLKSLEQVVECQFSIGFRFYAYLDQALLVVMECCCDLEDRGIICHTVVGVCSVLVLHCTGRNDLTDRVIILSILYIAVLVLIHAVKVILDQVECDRSILLIVLGVYIFNNVFECLIRAVEFECEVSGVQDPSKQSLFCIQLQCAFCMVLVMEVISIAVLDLDIELLYAVFDLFTRRCNSHIQGDLCRVIREVILSVINLGDRVGEAILKIFDPVDSDNDHILLGIIYGAFLCLVVHNVSECRILDGPSGVGSVDHVRALDSCDLSILAADDELKFFVLRQTVCELLGAGDILLASCLVIVLKLGLGICCNLYIQLGYAFLKLILGHLNSHFDGIYGCSVISDAGLSVAVYVALKLSHFVLSCQVFLKIFLAVVDLGHCDQVSFRIFFCPKSQIVRIRIHNIPENRILDHAGCIIDYCSKDFSGLIRDLKRELFILKHTAIQEFS